MSVFVVLSPPVPLAPRFPNTTSEGTAKTTEEQAIAARATAVETTWRNFIVKTLVG